MLNKLSSIASGFFSVEERDGVASNIRYAFVSQAIALASGFVMSLVVPKVLGVTEYAHWQLFLFYAGYVAITILGVGDGLYLRLGGKRFFDIDGASLKSEAILITASQVCIAFVIWAASLTVAMDDGVRFVLNAVLVYGLVQNCYGIIAPVFQAVNLTRVYSLSIAMSKLVFLVLMFFCILSGMPSYEPLVVSYIIGSLFSLFYCLICANSLLSVRHAPLSTVVKPLLWDMRNGFRVMIAYYASALIVGVARQIVVAKWGLETFGQMSFAFSIVSFALMFIAQLSLVLFPVLRRLDLEHLSNYYAKIRDLLFVISPLAYFIYFPLSFFLGIWLPDYAESFRYLGILMPILVFDGKMNMLCSTYFKVYNDTRQLLYFNLLALAISLFLSYIGAFALNNVEFVICGSLFAIMVRSIVSERYLAVKRLHLSYSKSLVLECLMAVGFVCSVNIGGVVSLLVPFGLYVLSFFLNREAFESVRETLANRGGSRS